MKTISLRIPDSLEFKLAAAAHRRGKSKSDVIREAIDAYLENGERSAGGRSVAELVRDLLGSVEGPGDLSHNPEYLEDFGR